MTKSGVQFLNIRMTQQELSHLHNWDFSTSITTELIEHLKSRCDPTTANSAAYGDDKPPP